GAAVEDHARFEAIHAAQRGADWRRWPAELRDPHGPGVAAFARRHAAEVEVHAFLQWRAAQGLAQAQPRARGAGVRVGLITGLAVGTDPAGSHAWSRPQDMLSGLSVGAPPDLFNPLGQDWGLTALSPRALHRDGFRGFTDVLRAGFTGAGG